MTPNNRFILAALIWLGVLCPTAPTAQAQDATADAPPRIITASRARQALQFAKLSADNGLTDLSLRAVDEALSGGSPIDPVQIAQGAAGVVATGSRTNVDQLNQEIYTRLTQLSDVWERDKADPARVSDVLIHVVVPPNRPQELFLYAPPLVQSSRPGSGFPAPRNLGTLLIDWCAKCGRTDELLKLVAARSEFPGAKVAAHVLSGDVAIRRRDFDAAREHLNQVNELAADHGDQHSLRLAAQLVLSAVAVPELWKAALPSIEKLLDRYVATADASVGRIEPAVSMLMAAGTMRLSSGDFDHAKKHFDRYLDLYRRNFARYSGTSGLTQQKFQLEKVAAEYLRYGDVEHAFPLITEAADLPSAGNAASATRGFLVARLLFHVNRLPADERYRMLSDWTFGSKNQNHVRVFSSFVSDRQPPALFASLVNSDRPDDNPFQPAGYGPLNDVISTAAALVQAAREAGKLDELRTRLSESKDEKVAGADLLWSLTAIEAGEWDAVKKILAPMIQQYQSGQQKVSNDQMLERYLLLVGILGRPEMKPQVEQFAQATLQYGKRNSRNSLVEHSRMVRAFLERHHWPNVRPDVYRRSQPRYWQPFDDVTAAYHAAGAPGSVWFVGEDHIHHAGGAQNDTLYFMYPLTGNFTVQFESPDGDWNEGAAGYGGLMGIFEGYQRGRNGYILSVGRRESLGRPNLFTETALNTRNKFTVTPDKAVLSINGHPVFEDPHAAESPFLFLHSQSYRNPSFSHFVISGEPVIPREVHLSDSPRMRGWVARFYGEALPSAFLNQDGDNPDQEQAAAADNLDWSWKEGEIVGRTVPRRGGGNHQQSRLFFERPLFSGETVSYEFHYVPGQELVHPALGRLTFLLRERGVRLHWMTDGPGEWSGLSSDHELDDPDGRRGPEKLPLKEGWNSLQLSLDGDLVGIGLNGVRVYERDVSFLTDRAFGLFHFKDVTRARARNVVLTGDWPETLPDEIRNNLTASREDPNVNERWVLSWMIGRLNLAKDAGRIYWKSLQMPDERRYQYLMGWVLPAPVQPNWRVHGCNTPSGLPHHVQKKYAALSVLSDRQVLLNADRGGIYVAPCIELVATARRLGKLAELRAETKKRFVDPANQVARRSQVTIFLLCDLAEGNFDAARKHFQDLTNTLAAVKATDPLLRAASITAASQGILFAETRREAIDLLEHVITDRIHKQQSGGWRWDHQVYNLRGLGDMLTFFGNDGSQNARPPALTQWNAVTHAKGDTLAVGVPPAQWMPIATTVQHRCGHESDWLFFKSPLQGNFTVECDLTSFGWREIYLKYADLWVGIMYQRDNFNLGNVNKQIRNVKLPSPIEGINRNYHYKLEIKDGTYRASINDREIYSQPLEDVVDPWLAFRAAAGVAGTISNVKITGNPTIPDEIPLSHTGKIVGWISDWFRESLGSSNSDWYPDGEEIVGRIRPNFAGMFVESLLRYQRPILEDGEIRYSFRYVPDKTLVHPALGRLAFILSPNGVREHWITGGRWDASGLDPAEMLDVPENRRGPAKLPLKENDLNTMVLALKGNTVTLTLNREAVYERTIDKTNNRLFGFFHWKDRTAARVRDVVYRGNWPKTLPPLDRQELARLPEDLRTFHPERLPQQMRHDFANGNAPPERFQFNRNSQIASATPGGLRIVSAGKDKWSEVRIVTKFALKGNFDVAAEFADLKLEPPGESLRAMANLSIEFRDESRSSIRVGRIIDGKNKQVADGLYAYRQADGKNKYLSHLVPSKITAGTFRLVRTGGVVYFLLAEPGDDEFQLLGTRLVEPLDVPRGGLQLKTIAGKSGTETAVEWKRLDVAADEIDYTAP